MPESLREKLKLKCRHFNGTINDTCEAGVRYKDVRHSPTASGYSLPCFSAPGCHCDKRSIRSGEEIDAYMREIDQRFGNIMTARKAIMDHAEGKRGVSGRILCPVCKEGTLRYSIAGINGHIHANCTTADCVSWME